MSLSGRFTNRLRVVHRALRTRSYIAAPFRNSLNSRILSTYQSRSFCATSKETPEAKATDQAEETEIPEETTHETEVTELHAKIAELTKQVEEFRTAALEYKAEAYNIRTRGEKALDNSKKFAVEKFAKDILVISDNIELAIANIPKPDPAQKEFYMLYEGVEMTHKTAHGVFGKYGLKKAESKGVKFDMNVHEVLFTMPGTEDQEKGLITQVIREGYYLNDRVIRSAQVGVVG